MLIVEDNPGDVLLAEEAFADAGISAEFHATETGPEALDVLRRSHDEGALPDLILLDLNLPGMSGHDVLREIRNDEHLTHAIVIVLSSSAATDDVLQAYGQHANSYIQKPAHPREFAEAVERLSRFWLDTAELPTDPERL